MNTLFELEEELELGLTLYYYGEGKKATIQRVDADCYHLHEWKPGTWGKKEFHYNIPRKGLWISVAAYQRKWSIRQQ